MILIGQYDSPFVRRVGIALTLYGLPFEHRPWSSFSDAEKIRAYNPLTRVPTLVLDDGAVLVDSHGMLDYLDSRVPPERALFPAGEPARHRALAVAGLATGLADKAVSLFYEQRLHREVSEAWAGRCRAQIAAALAALEADRAGQRRPLLVRRPHRPRRHRGRLHAALHRRGARRPGRHGRLSRARRPRRPAGGAARLSGDQPALHPAGVTRRPPPSVSDG